MSLNDVESIADLVARAIGPATVRGHDGREFLVVPNGYSEKEVSDPYGLKLARPSYIHQAVTLQAVDSLVEYVNRYRSEETLLFADIANDKVVAVVDYHGAATGDAAAGRANYGAHRATTTLIRSEEWKLWSGISGKLMPQLEFARFVEENAADVVAPDGAELLEAVRDLQAHRKVNFIKAVRTSSDNENFEFTDETEARTKGGLELPTKFKLALPVYFGEPTTDVFAFLRWKLDEGQLTLGIQLHRAEFIRQAVFRQIVVAVGERTKCPVVFGVPA